MKCLCILAVILSAAAALPFALNANDELTNTLLQRADFGRPASEARPKPAPVESLNQQGRGGYNDRNQQQGRGGYNDVNDQQGLGGYNDVNAPQGAAGLDKVFHGGPPRV